MLAPAALMEKEAAAVAAIDALKSAAIIKSKKADWRLVAAAQAMRRGDFNDEFDAAMAMGKKIGQRREVANWVGRLEQLAQLAAPTSGDATAHSLLVDSAWVAPPRKDIHSLVKRTCSTWKVTKKKDKTKHINNNYKHNKQ